MSTQTTFYPAPAIESPIITVTVFGPPNRSSIKEDIADWVRCDPDDLQFEEIAWDDMERFADFVTLHGRVIGSLDEKLTPSEWVSFFSSRVPDPEARMREILNDVRFGLNQAAE